VKKVKKRGNLTKNTPKNVYYIYGAQTDIPSCRLANHAVLATISPSWVNEVKMASVRHVTATANQWLGQLYNRHWPNFLNIF